MHNEAHIDGCELQPRAERWHPSSASLSPLPSSQISRSGPQSRDADGLFRKVEG